MKKIPLNKYIILILVFYIIWLLGLPLIFPKVFPLVSQKISAACGFSIVVQNPELRLNVVPTARFRADKIIIEAQNTKAEMENPDISIRILPLLSGKVHINNFYSSSININLRLRQKPELDRNFITNLDNLKLKCKKLQIDKFVLTLNQNNVTEPFVYTADNIVYQKNGRFIKLFTNSRVNIKKSMSEINVDLFLPKNNDIEKSKVSIKISNFELKPLKEYLKNYLPADLVNINGSINASVDKDNLHAVFNNGSFIMKDSAKSLVFPDNLKVDSKFHITRKFITFDSVKINSKNIHSTISGSVFDYLDRPTTTVDLNVQLDTSKVEDIISLLPPFVIEEINAYKLKKYKMYGDVIANFTVKGNIAEPEVNGDVFVDNVILISPIKNANGATVKLSFKGKYVNFDVTVPAGGTEKVWVKGGVELYNVKYADMRVWSTPKVDLQLAESKVNPIHEILNFIIGPVPIMDIKGSGNIDIIVKGNRKNPHVWGTLNFYNVTTFFNEIPNLVLKDAQAVLKFNDQNAVFTTKKGYINGKTVEINGTCNLYGKFDFDVASDNQEISYLYNAIQTSTMIDEIKEMLPKLDICGGMVNLKLKVYGAIKDIEYIKFNENLFTDGEIILLGNTFGMQGMEIHNTKGKVNITGTNAAAEISSYIGSSPLAAKAQVRNNAADLSIEIPKLAVKDIIPASDNFVKEAGNIVVNVIAKYKGKINEIEYEKINFNARVIASSKDNKLKLSSGEVSFDDNNLKISNLRGSISDSGGTFDINISAKNPLSQKPDINGSVYLKSFSLPEINKFANYLSEELRDNINQIRFDNGKINLNCRVNHSKINAYTDLGGLKFTYVPLNMPVQIVNGSLIMRNNNLRLNKINLIADGMPILADGTIKDVLSKQNFDMYFNSKPKQEFIDKYINKNQIYPVKIKGDIVYSANLKGEKNNFDVKSEVNMSKDSSIYHLGATIGDVENAIVLNLDAKIQELYKLKIKEFSYDKLISSQSGRETRLNMLKAKGGIDVYKEDLGFHNLYIKTNNPTDARIFNIIFRKPNIKQGQFTSDLVFNGKLSNPKLVGDFHIFETNIPFLDTTLKSIIVSFKDKTINLSSKGEILGNDISIQGVMKNKLTPPYYIENAQIYTGVLDLNYIIDKLKLSQVDNYSTFASFEGFDVSTAVVKNLKMRADSIHLRNIIAEDFEASMSFNDKKILNVNDFKFNLARGNLDGALIYNLANNYTELNLKASDIDANDLSIALFDLQNQIYGDLTGSINLSCSGVDFNHCMKTLNGKTVFNVTEGRMPKLGSLEYLLKAGNLLKGGLTGVSINSVIDLVTPLKTGEFSNISGELDIKDGIAHDIEIITRGKDLSLYISGNYNFSTSIANMEVLGLLSKKISTMFGPVGNLSLNTLFNVIPGVDLSKDSRVLEQINKIPGIELSSKAYRKFIAEIKGNINGDNYVTSFKWIN